VTRCHFTLVIPFTFLAILTAAQSGSDPLPSFEVASVKPSAPPGPGHPPDQNIGPASLSVKASTLKALIGLAYRIQYYQIAGGPSWTESSFYDVDARSEKAVSAADIRLMLRSMLADRFQLKIHQEVRPVAMNVLLVAKGGPKYGPSFHPRKEGDPPADLGKFTSTHLAYPNYTIADFVIRLRTMTMIDPVTGKPAPSLPVYDGTQLTGRYDIVLYNEMREDWSTMLEQQLGLKLEERKVPTDTLVIDSAVKPSIN
jgi:uncharacterized protein (TIGR03435 family)